MFNKKISQMEEISVLNDSAYIPVIQTIDDSVKNYKINKENFINNIIGIGVDSISKRVITHSDGGTINVETFVGKVEVSLGYGYGYGYEGSIMIGEW